MYCRSAGDVCWRPTPTTTNEDENEEQRKSSPLGGYFTCNKSLAIVLGNIIGLVALGAIGGAVGISVSSTCKLFILLNFNWKILIFHAVKQGFGVSCKITSDCATLSSNGLICYNGNCSCITTSYYDGTSCC